MKVLVTGAGGFIGSHTVDYLVSRRYKVLALDNFSTGKTENLKDFHGPVEVCDITDLKLLEMVFNKFRPDAIIHLAAQSAITIAWNDPQKDMDTNIRGTLNLLMLAKKYGVNKFVFSSTSAVYGKGNKFFSSNEQDSCSPDTPYGISKLAAEHYIRLLFPNHVILRYANIYGPRQRPIGENQVIARAFDHFIHGADFSVVGDGKQKRDFVFVGDVVYANYTALAERQTGTFNIASGKSLSVNRVLSALESHFGVIGYRWAHTNTKDERGSAYLSGRSFTQKFGWKPTVGLEDGITQTAEWWSNISTKEVKL